MGLESRGMNLKLWFRLAITHRCWEGLRARGEGDDRGWDGWMASLTRWTWVWVNSRSWWWTGRPGVLWFMGSQRVRHDWVTELNWTDSVSWWRLSVLVLGEFSSVQFSRSVVSNSLWPHEPQHARPPCPSPTPRVHPNPCPLIGDVVPLKKYLFTFKIQAYLVLLCFVLLLFAFFGASQLSC